MPLDLRVQLDRLLTENRHTLQEVTDLLKSQGARVSVSAVHRYAQELAKQGVGQSAPATRVTSGEWFCTYTGQQVFVLNPWPEQICIEDIAHGLSNTCRFGGQCRTFYSVAQHSLMVAAHVPTEMALAGLLHDASEAYLGDVIRPLKRQLDEYQAIEATWERAIARRFGLPSKLPTEIKQADLRALMTERLHLLPAQPATWNEDEARVEPFPEAVVPMTPSEAETAFLERFGALFRKPSDPTLARARA